MNTDNIYTTKSIAEMTALSMLGIEWEELRSVKQGGEKPPMVFAVYDIEKIPDLTKFKVVYENGEFKKEFPLLSPTFEGIRRGLFGTDMKFEQDYTTTFNFVRDQVFAKREENKTGEVK